MISRAQSTSERLARPYEVQYETTVKTILRLEEEDDQGVTTLREKEQFSHCLNLLFADGRTAVLTADAPVEEEPIGKETMPMAAESAQGPDGSHVSRKFRIEEA